MPRFAEQVVGAAKQGKGTGGRHSREAREEHDVEEEFTRSGAEAGVGISLPEAAGGEPQGGGSSGRGRPEPREGQTTARRLPEATGGEQRGGGGADGSAEGGRRRHGVDGGPSVRTGWAGVRRPCVGAVVFFYIYMRMRNDNTGL